MASWQESSLRRPRVSVHPHVPDVPHAHTGPSSRYVRVNKFVELTGYTDKAVRCKIAEGVWLEGKHWRRAPDGAILVDMVGYERWVEGREAPA